VMIENEINLYGEVKRYLTTNSTKQKREILNNIINRSYKLRQTITKLYDPRLNNNFQIQFTKKQIEVTSNRAHDVEIFRPDVISDVINQIKSINQPTERKNYIINILPRKLSKLELKFLMLLVNKDIGLSYRTLTTIIPDLPYFPFQLAQPINKVQDKLTKSTTANELIIQPKYDGIRIIYNPRNREFYTRNQEVLKPEKRPNLEHIASQFDKLISIYPELGDFVFDGELFAGNWNDTMTLTSSETQLPNYEKLGFIVYDLISLKDYLGYRPTSGKTSIVDGRAQLERVETLYELFNNSYDSNKQIYHITPNIKLAPITQIPIDYVVGDETIMNLIDEYVSLGYEGCMVKLPDSPYVDGRKEYWVKLKPTNEIEGIIVDVLEGDGKHAGKVGSFIVKSVINGREVIYKVGSGMSDEQRKQYWNNRTSLIGKIVDVKYQELTKDGIPRFPILVRVRTDKNEPNF